MILRWSCAVELLELESPGDMGSAIKARRIAANIANLPEPLKKPADV
jgi:hypothetical protein